MASLTIQEESSTKEEGDKIWALVTQYYNELVKAQDPTDLAQKIEDHAKQLGDLRVRCPAEADTYSSIDAVLEKTRSIVDAFSQAKGHPERLSSESTERVEPESTECVAPETAEVQTVDNGDSASRRTQAGNSSNKRKKSASDSDQDKPQKSKRRKASRSPEIWEVDDDNRCSRCQRLQIQCIQQAGKGRTCKTCFEGHAQCDRADNSITASLQRDMAQLYRKYDDILSIVNQSHQYAILMASHCMQAMDNYAELSSRMRAIEAGTRELVSVGVEAD